MRCAVVRSIKLRRSAAGMLAAVCVWSDSGWGLTCNRWRLGQRLAVNRKAEHMNDGEYTSRAGGGGAVAGHKALHTYTSGYAHEYAAIYGSSKVFRLPTTALLISLLLNPLCRHSLHSTEQDSRSRESQVRSLHFTVELIQNDQVQLVSEGE